MYIEGSIKNYLDDAAARLPAPGGGSVSALTGAVGVAMLSMVANFTLGKKQYQDVQSEVAHILKKSEGLRSELEHLTEDDVQAYGAVSAACKLPRTTEEEKSKRSEAIEKACYEALKVPLQVSESCMAALRIASRLVEIGNVNLISDVGVAVVLLEGALRGATLNVIINLSSLKEERFINEKRAVLDSLMEEGNKIKEDVWNRVYEEIA